MFGPLKATVRLMWPPVKVSLTPLLNQLFEATNHYLGDLGKFFRALTSHGKMNYLGVRQRTGHIGNSSTELFLILLLFCLQFSVYTYLSKQLSLIHI